MLVVCCEVPLLFLVPSCLEPYQRRLPRDKQEVKTKMMTNATAETNSADSAAGVKAIAEVTVSVASVALHELAAEVKAQATHTSVALHELAACKNCPFCRFCRNHPCTLRPVGDV